jgi:E3 ubiquitin-protein ligase DOA10
MIVLLSCSISSSSKSFSTGRLEGDSIKVAIADLKRANVKMVQLDYEKEINNNLNQIIKNDSVIIANTNAKYKVVKKQRNAAIGTIIGILILVIIL